MAEITAAPEVLDELEEEYGDGPLVMLNLLKFTPGEEDAYQEYGSTVKRMVEERGGRFLYVGEAVLPMVGAEWEVDEWDTVALVEYPSVEDFVSMIRSEEYQRIHTLRERGLARTVLCATRPILSV